MRNPATHRRRDFSFSNDPEFRSMRVGKLAPSLEQKWQTFAGLERTCENESQRFNDGSVSPLAETVLGAPERIDADSFGIDSVFSKGCGHGSDGEPQCVTRRCVPDPHAAILHRSCQGSVRSTREIAFSSAVPLGQTHENGLCFDPRKTCGRIRKRVAPESRRTCRIRLRRQLA